MIVERHVWDTRDKITRSYLDVQEGPSWIAGALPAVERAAGHIGEHPDVVRIAINAGPTGIALWVHLRWQARGDGIDMRGVAQMVACTVLERSGVRVQYGPGPASVDDRWMPVDREPLLNLAAVFWCESTRDFFPPPSFPPSFGPCT